ncbi:MAG TPA: phytanoyl-CoA dioxygenase family protein [Planctomycetota bacterium]|nr:phytanoyl-CoA dioxygenase family protein [Planctomycetota bacterium]
MSIATAERVGCTIKGPFAGPKVPVKVECLPTDADVKFYQENGYWISPKLFTDEELLALAEHQDRVYAGIHETGHAPWWGGWRFNPKRPLEIRKTDNSFWSDLTLRAAVLSPTIGAIAARLHGVDVVRLWHDQLLYKPSGGEKTGNVGWHQDYDYWRASKEPNLTTATIAVSDQTMENGVISVVPGSHKRGVLNASDFFNQNLDEMQSKIEAETGTKMKPVPMSMKAGQIGFHHCLAVHGSAANTSGAARRSIAVHLMCGTIHRNINGKHMNTELVELKDGDPFVGDYFPVLYQR